MSAGAAAAGAATGGLYSPGTGSAFGEDGFVPGAVLAKRSLSGGGGGGSCGLSQQSSTGSASGPGTPPPEEWDDMVEALVPAAAADVMPGGENNWRGAHDR